MTDKLRASGIEAIGELPWGTHICQFYESGDDLRETLVPWVVEGLRGNELCVWIVPDPMSVDAACAALRAAIPELSTYADSDRIRVLEYGHWHLDKGTLASERVLDAWTALSEEANAAGLDGLRIASSASWSDATSRRQFMEYERAMHRLIRGRRVIAICAYHRPSLTQLDIAEAVSNHSIALMREASGWRALKRAGLLHDEEDMRSRERRCDLITGLTSEHVFRLEIASDGVFALEWLTGGFSEASGYAACEIATFDKLQSIIHPETRPSFKKAIHKVLAAGSAETEIRYMTSTGTLRWMKVHLSPEYHHGTRIIKGITGRGKDITDRKTAEARILESEKMFRGLYESTSDGVIRVGLDNRITASNPALSAMLGYTAEELAHMSYPDITAPEERAADICLKDHLAADGTAEYEKELVASDGRRVPARVKAWLLRDHDGAQAGFCASIKDLTESKEAEKRALNSENILNGLILGLPGVFCVIDRRGHLVKWNRALEDITGYTHDEIASMRPVDFFDPEDAGRVTGKINDAFTLSAAEMEADFVARDGTRTPFHLRAVLTRVNNEPYIIGTGADISKWRAAEKTLIDARDTLEANVAERTKEILDVNRLLKKSEERFRALVEMTSDWVWEVDTDGAYTYASPKVKEILGYEPIELLGKKPFELMPPDEARRVSAIFSSFAALKRPFALIENRNIRKDGREVVLETSGTPILDPSGRLLGYRGVDRDITNRKLREDARAFMDQHEGTPDSVGAASALAGGIAHDFNNLMAAIRINSGMAMKKADPATARFLEQIDAAAAKAEGLTRGLLVFCRRKPSELRPLDINRLVTDTLSQLHRLTGEKVRVETALSEGTARIMGDRVGIEQIITNLVVNAIDAMPCGGLVRVSTGMINAGHSSPPQYPRASHLRLTVEDTGAGMDPVVLKRIFDPFFTTRGPRAAGLGLAVVHEIMRDVGGWVDVESRPGEGTRFDLYFPAALPGEGVLVVEDERPLREGVAVVLSKNGYRVFEAAGAREAMALFDRERDNIDIVFCDMVLSDMDGIDLLDDFSKAKPSIKPIITCAKFDVAALLPAIKGRGYHVLQKPFDIPSLLRSVCKALEKNT